ncbi:MAG: hypothetical protein NTU43_02705, partial [Bacteroidetes bacterium]|nr:hypothetical protein [Bacteroidota bacterium]
LKSVKNEFDDFREIVSQYSAKNKIISQLYAAFKQNYEHTLPSLQGQLVDKTQSRSKIHTEINEDLNPKKSDFDRKIGGKVAEIQNEAEKLNEKEAELFATNSFEPENILNESLANYDKNRKEIESRLTMIDIQKLKSNQIEYKVMSLKNQVQNFENQIKNYSDLLINKISGNKDNRKMLNAILSEQVKALPGKQVKKAIHKISDTLKIFDGEIDISKNIVQKDFESIEEIKEKLDQTKAELKSQDQLLETVKDMEKSQSDLQVILNEIETIKIKLQKIKNKPTLVKNIEKLKAVITEINTQKEQFENELKAISKKIAQKSNELNEINDEIKKRGDRIAQLQDFKRELESLGLVADEDFESTEDLDLLYNKIKLNQNDRFTLKINKDNLFEKLRDKLQSTFADERDFIKYVEEEIALIDDKERSIQSLLESISTQFANPAYTLLKRYDEFKEFVNNKFNHKLSQSRISDIESLSIELVDNKKLVEEVKKISQIQQVKGQLMFEFDHSENLKILDAYLESGKKIDFENLFDITLHLTRKGSTKPVDLNEQIESDGTDKMIRLMIVMNIINRLAIADDENRIVLFIDEVATIDKQNRPELVRFCREHYFIPIFAAPDAVAGFGKYYFIYPNAGKINVNEKVNAMYGENNSVAVR